MTLVDVGLTVEHGGARVDSGGMSVTGGMVPVDEGLTIESGDMNLIDGKLGINVDGAEYMIDVQSFSTIGGCRTTIDDCVPSVEYTESSTTHNAGADSTMTVSGVYTGNTEGTFEVEISFSGNPDEFRWRKDDGVCSDVAEWRRSGLHRGRPLHVYPSRRRSRRFVRAEVVEQHSNPRGFGCRRTASC